MAVPGSALELLQELIRIPSVNPAGTPGTPHTGEVACAEYLAGLLRGWGAETRVQDTDPGRPNVVARWPAPGKPRLLWAPHTDTVSVVGMTVDPFGGERREGRIYGRGASDTKGSIAAMLWALQTLGPERLRGLSHEIWFAGLAGEEAGQQGAKALAAEQPFDFVVAGEPTNMQVVHVHKGSNQLHLTTRGRAVHAANPSAGVNAISKMLAVLRVVQEEIAPELPRFHHPLLGPATLSIGTIQGGSKTNIVPDHCHATVDMRTVPGQVTPAWTEHLRARLAAACPEVEIEMVPSEPLHTDPEHPLIRLLQAGGATLTGAPWFCDAAVFARHGAPAIAMGPGSIAQAHTEDEWISEADLQTGVEGFTRFLHHLA